MSDDQEFKTLLFTPQFMRQLIALSPPNQRRILRALELLDGNERHPSLNVHPLHGPLEGSWAVYASQGLRVTFVRLEGGRKLLQTCSQHYGD